MQLLKERLGDYGSPRKVVSVCSCGKRVFVPDIIEDIAKSCYSNTDNFWDRVSKISSPHIAHCKTPIQMKNCFQCFALSEIIVNFPIHQVLTDTSPWDMDFYNINGKTISLPKFIIIVNSEGCEATRREFTQTLISRVNSVANKHLMNVTERRLNSFVYEHLIHGAIEKHGLNQLQKSAS